MKSQAQLFNFSSYLIGQDQKTIGFNYQIEKMDDKKLNFTETLILPEKIIVKNYDQKKLLEIALQNLHLMLGISYWKTYCPKEIKISSFQLNEEQAGFWNVVYTKGLGEFFYKNQIDFRGLIRFPFQKNVTFKPISYPFTKRSLIGIGGGKDSAVAVELLKKESLPFSGFVVETAKNNRVIFEMIQAMKINFYSVKRILDPQLFLLNKSKEVYNGHVPISAIHAFISLLLAVVYDYSEIFTANEKSASEGNVKYLDQTTNHQWSKSEEFEKLFQNYIRRFVTPGVNLKSLIRPYTELEITKVFVQHKKYHHIFSSCNANFRLKSTAEKRWCGQCPKCLFVFIQMAAFLPKKEALAIFSENLLNKPTLLPLFLKITGKEGFKPFECVGTVAEVTSALELIKQKKQFKDDYLMKFDN